MRKLATACGIAVGSVYRYFPTKTDLTASVLERFFAEALFEECCRIRPGERFTTYLRNFRDALQDALQALGIDWFAEMQRLPYRERSAVQAAQAPLIKHMERGLVRVLESDSSVLHGRLTDALRPEILCPFALESILASLREGSDCETLFSLLDTALYADEEASKPKESFACPR